MTSGHLGGFEFASGADVPENSLYFPDGLLELQRKELREISMTQAIITDQGILSQETGAHQWGGLAVPISLNQRLLKKEISPRDIEYALSIINEFFVPVTAGSTIRCIDGRTIEGYDDNDAEKYHRILGPQVPGGSPGGAVALRLATGNRISPFNEATLAQDVDEFSAVSALTGLVAGGHCDEKAGPGKTGCGAVDSIEEVLAMFNPSKIQDLEKLTQMILGRDLYRAESFDKVIASSIRLLSVENSYFESKKHILDKLREINVDSAPALVGEHKEIALVVNYVPGTTFHTDHYNTATGGKTQAFNYDIWYSKLIASSLNASEKLKSRYLHARVALAVGTLMYLTDGTQRLLVRTPLEQAA